jgi:hypothetical protein
MNIICTEEEAGRSPQQPKNSARVFWLRGHLFGDIVVKWAKNTPLGGDGFFCSDAHFPIISLTIAPLH